ncbi:MAG: aminotransferase class I/II-fold pyridoxal phosphate-dependent enzyme [Spirochaetaceae bacterium]|jgi:histidinol-phosphate aminotransferase|nr:aminotransferase class I/II-fold pyridoxal phosphate-dependent enzyme [Spirochaetaceae bacterium]
MSSYWNSRVRKLDPYTPGEQPRDRKFIKLNTNENPYPPPPGVIEAIREAAGEGLRLYPDPSCLLPRLAIAEQYGVRPGQVFVGNGSDEVLAFAFAAFFGKGAGGDDNGVPLLLFPDISYSFYPVYAGLWDIPFKTIPLTENFTIDLSSYHVNSGGVIFPNPNAPTGIALKAEEILPVAEYQARDNRVIIVDEAYGAFAGSGPLPGKGLLGAESLVPYTDRHPNMLTVHTLSKTASLAGLRAGFAIGNKTLIEGLCRVRDSFNSYPVDRLAQAGIAAAMADAAHYAETARKVIATRERVIPLLREEGFRTLPSAANFIFIRHPEKTGAALFAALRERGILVRHWDRGRIADFLRVSIGTDAEMDEFLSAARQITGRGK